MLSSQIDAKEAHAEVQRDIYLPELRSRFSEMAGAMSRLRRVEYPAGRGFLGESAQIRPIGPALAGRRFHAAGGRGRSRATSTDHRLRRTRSSAGRRPGAGLRDPDRRRSRHRQIDADAAGGGGARRPPAGAVRHGRGILEAGRASRPPPGAGGGRGAADRRDLRGGHRRRSAPASGRAC